MKVGIYGNNLNQAYFLAECLRHHGVEARAFLLPDTDRQDIPSWWSEDPVDEALVVRLQARPRAGGIGRLTWRKSIRSLYRAAEEYDVLVLREDGPAVFSEYHNSTKVFASQGADLQVWPWLLQIHYMPPSLRNRSRKRSRSSRQSPMSATIKAAEQLFLFPGRLRRQRRQRAGIRQCSGAIVSPTQRALLQKLGFNRPVEYIPVPSTSPTHLAVHTRKSRSASPSLWDKSDVIFLHPTRMFFLRDDHNPFLKDNDKLLYAFSEFVRDFAGTARLALFRKGRPADLVHAQQLVYDLDIADFVDWLPELRNEDLQSLYELPNVVICDQFSPFLNVLGNIGRESLRYGRWLISSYDGAEDVMYSSFPPNVLTANTPTTIASAMRQATISTEEQREDLARRCSIWYAENLDPIRNASRYHNFMSSLTAGGASSATQ